MRRRLLPRSGVLLLTLLETSAGVGVFPMAATVAADIYVNHQTGDDHQAGTHDHPLATANRALRNASPGDTIHLQPAGAVYREMLVIDSVSGIVIEGHGCTFSGADPLPEDPGAWEHVGPDLHRLRIARNPGDRYLLVCDGAGRRMGRNKFSRGPLASQFPPLDQLQPGDFRVEPIEGGRDAWLYVKGGTTNLEWGVRMQGVTTRHGRHVRDVTLRNINVRHALNDGFNFHGDAQHLRLENVNGYENYDNGISPHGGCSLTVVNGAFWGNGTPAWAQGDATETVYRNCQARGSGHAWEVVFAGGVHLVEDSLIRLSGNELLLAHWPPAAGARTQIAFAGKDPHTASRVTLRRTHVAGDDEAKGTVKVAAGVTLALEDCTFTNVTFEVDPAASVRLARTTLDGKPLEALPRTETSNDDLNARDN